jgi:hypothetical protein
MAAIAATQNRPPNLVGRIISGNQSLPARGKCRGNQSNPVFIL